MRRAITREDLPWTVGRPMAAAVRAGEVVFCGGHAAVGPDGAVLHPGDVAAQARVAIESLLASLEQAGGTPDDLVELTSFCLDPREIPAATAAAAELLPTDSPPAWTAVATTGAVIPGALVAVRGIAVLGGDEKRCVAPRVRSSATPGSAACAKGGLGFATAQPLAADGSVREPGSHSTQAREALDEIARLAGELGGSLADVLDVLSFHQDARGMPDVAGAWEEAFPGVGPADAAALSTIGVPALAERGVIGQYRAIFDFSPGKRMARVPETVWWKEMPIAGVTKKEGGSLVGIAGQVSSDGDGEILHRGDPRAQAEYCFAQIEAGLALLGGSLADVVEVTAFHKDSRDWEDVAAAAGEVFGDNPPAWTSVGTTGLYQEGYLHEIHAIAMIE